MMPPYDTRQDAFTPEELDELDIEERLRELIRDELADLLRALLDEAESERP